MTLPNTAAVVRDARRAVKQAQAVRAEQRKRRREDRAEALVKALAGLSESMAAVRPLVHSSARREVPNELELREVSDAIQRERRKLRKMLNTTLAREGVVTLDGGWS